jgi:hypothetical protein
MGSMTRTSSLMFGVGVLVGFSACFLLLTNWAQKNIPHNALNQDQPPSSTQPDQVPHAAAVFRLRSECAKMGEKVLAASVASSGPAFTQDQNSHYEPRSAHCYVELYVRGPDVTKDNIRYLFDGQTNELLAASGFEKGKMMRMVFATGALTNDADDYINEMMTDKDR